eukprot:CAMPEP_0172598210 /NCGR_PEP_ID=MMETSP1068-20121228/18230_1 /TAXON_ID=35684 /ORGANISM="Pseudopedinella elastica, Strain CCMP716" /LENGTH=359 /DNA_ID=CAMNT_0013398001 /DNA_START=171 /DNA_END=1250 /DNA_ORIENTATION=+
MALVLVHPRTGTELASLLQSDDPITKKNEAAIHFSGTDHFIDTVLFRHDDCANPRYKGRLYQVVKRRDLTVGSGSSPLLMPADHTHQLTNAELRRELATRGLSTAGRKVDLIGRLSAPPELAAKYSGPPGHSLLTAAFGTTPLALPVPDLTATPLPLITGPSPGAGGLLSSMASGFKSTPAPNSSIDDSTFASKIRRILSKIAPGRKADIINSLLHESDGTQFKVELMRKPPAPTTETTTGLAAFSQLPRPKTTNPPITKTPTAHAPAGAPAPWGSFAPAPSEVASGGVQLAPEKEFSAAPPLVTAQVPSNAEKPAYSPAEISTAQVLLRASLAYELDKPDAKRAKTGETTGGLKKMSL